MSKDTFVAATAQGGGPGSGGGGPAGTWTKLQQGSTAISAGATVTLTSVATPAPGILLVAFVSMHGAGTNHLCQGTTAAAPNTTTIVWDFVVNGAQQDLKARGGATISADTLDWVVYQFTPA